MSGAAANLARKIHSAQDLSSVVRSMKALAASSVGQYQRAVESLHDYTRTVELALAVCLRDGMHPVTVVRRGAPAGLVVFGSDQGLVGRFNEIVMEFVSAGLPELPTPVAMIWAVGARMEQLVGDAAPAPTTGLRVPNSVETIAAFVGELLVRIEQARAEGRVGAIYLYHNEPLPGSIYRPVRTRLLPLDETWQRQLIALRWSGKALPEVLDGAASALPTLVRNHLFAVLFQACAQSLASENASRLAAMQRAEENIADMVLSLTGKFHRLRQALIDEELFEVVAGYEALNSAGAA